jgi:hypothetical protein
LTNSEKSSSRFEMSFNVAALRDPAGSQARTSVNYLCFFSSAAID